MKDNFYKRILFLLIEPILSFKSEWIRDVAENMQTNAKDNITYDCAKVLIKIANMISLVEWVFSEMSMEELDD